MISRAILEKDEGRRCYVGTIDWYGIAIPVEVFPSWSGDKKALELRLLPAAPVQ